jgi:hypothetical protein
MLKEIRPTKCDDGRHRRWFSDEYFDLIIWYGDTKVSVTGFQLCYDKEGMERAFSWSIDKGAIHNRIDNGEASPFKNMSPILVPDGAIPFGELMKQFQARAKDLDKDVFDLVVRELSHKSNWDADNIG